MTDNNPAIAVIKQLTEQFELKEDEQHREDLRLKEVQRKLVLERDALTTRESAFLSKVDGHGAEVERITKMEALARKMKAQIDEDRAEMKLERTDLDKREKKIIDLEKKQVELEKREELVSAREEDIGDREELVDKEKKDARSKQKDLDLREKAIKKLRNKLQGMIDRQKI